MKIKNCKVGMKVQDENGCKEEIAEICEGRIRFLNVLNLLKPENFEPLYNWVVGEDVVTYNNEKVEIWGVKYDDDKKIARYATVDKYGHDEFYWEDELQQLKKRDELERGDKLKDEHGNEYKVIAREKDYYKNKIVYFCRIINDDKFEGKLTVIFAHCVDEIIYD